LTAQGHKKSKVGLIVPKKNDRIGAAVMSEYWVVRQYIFYLLLKLYSKYKLDRNRNITHDTDINIKKIEKI